MICKDNQKNLCGKIECKICLKRSFASHSRATNWTIKNIIQPHEVFLSSGKKYWFKCDKCNHEFESSLNKISNGKWCPFCSNPPHKLCDKSDCKLCLKKSFAYHFRAKHWSSKNILSPREVFISSHNKYWFDCDICYHEFESILSNVSNGQWCPYCSNPPKILCNKQNCQLCLKKSFACHFRSKNWSTKNILLPQNVFISSDNKYWFICDICDHEFESRLSGILNGYWCPFCSNPPQNYDNIYCN